MLISHLLDEVLCIFFCEGDRLRYRFTSQSLLCAEGAGDEVKLSALDMFLSWNHSQYFIEVIR